MKNPLVSMIIVSYNGGNLIDKCIWQALHQNYRNIEIIIIDNASSDGSFELLQRKYSDRVLLVKNRINVGFPKACNQAARIARGKYLLFLNQDAILERTAIEELIKVAIQHRASLYQPNILMYNNPKIINSRGLSIHLAGFGLLRDCGKLNSTHSNVESLEEIYSIHGACFLIYKDDFEKLGMFDELFFAFNEDTDISWRALINGKKILYVPSAIVYHKWGYIWRSPSLLYSKLYYAERNRLVMVLSNYQKRSLVLLLPILILAEISTLAYCLAKGLLKVKINVYADIIRIRYHIVKRRNYIQSLRKVDDRYILKNFTYEFKHPFLVRSTKLLNLLFKLLYNLLVSRL